MPDLLPKKIILICCSCFLLYCINLPVALHGQPTANPTSLKFLGKYEIPYATLFGNTTIGGLSGIDYDAVNNQFFVISDDKGEWNAARYYTVNISVGNKGITGVKFTGVYNMLQSNGKPYPLKSMDPLNNPDPEAIRFNPRNRQLTWTSEGERNVNRKDTLLQDPSLTNITTRGKFLFKYPIPGVLRMQATEKGPRSNGTLESISFADQYTSLFACLEEPLYQDGPRADTFQQDSYVRLFKFEVAGRKHSMQYAYPLDPVARSPYPAGAFKINGVSDILHLRKNKLLVTERSFSSGRLACTVKLFIADLSQATDISNIPSLSTSANFTAVSKKRLLNMDELGIYIDNIEGACFGPLLPNGHKTLLFIADNNFNPLQKTQLLLFEVIE